MLNTALLTPRNIVVIALMSLVFTMLTKQIYDKMTAA